MRLVLHRKNRKNSKIGKQESKVKLVLHRKPEKVNDREPISLS